MFKEKICIFSRFSDVIHVRGCVNSSILSTGDLKTISISLRTVELDGKWIIMKNWDSVANAVAPLELVCLFHVAALLEPICLLSLSKATFLLTLSWSPCIPIGISFLYVVLENNLYWWAHCCQQSFPILKVETSLQAYNAMLSYDSLFRLCAMPFYFPS